MRKTGFSGALKEYGGPISSTGYGSILELLQRQGATDPRLMNRNLADMDLQNQMAQRQGMASLAQGGYGGGSNMGGQALMSSIVQGGNTNRANYLGQEAALQEERRRQDLQLMNLLFGPKFQRRGLRNQLDIAKMQANANQGGGLDLGALFNLGSGIAGAI